MRLKKTPVIQGSCKHVPESTKGTFFAPTSKNMNELSYIQVRSRWQTVSTREQEPYMWKSMGCNSPTLYVDVRPCQSVTSHFFPHVEVPCAGRDCLEWNPIVYDLDIIHENTHHFEKSTLGTFRYMLAGMRNKVCFFNVHNLPIGLFCGQSYIT